MGNVLKITAQDVGLTIFFSIMLLLLVTIVSLKAIQRLFTFRLNAGDKGWNAEFVNNR